MGLLVLSIHGPPEQARTSISLLSNALTPSTIIRIITSRTRRCPQTSHTFSILTQYSLSTLRGMLGMDWAKKQEEFKGPVALAHGSEEHQLLQTCKKAWCWRALAPLISSTKFWTKGAVWGQEPWHEASGLCEALPKAQYSDQTFCTRLKNISMTSISMEMAQTFTKCKSCCLWCCLLQISCGD